MIVRFSSSDNARQTELVQLMHAYFPPGECNSQLGMSNSHNLECITACRTNKCVPCRRQPYLVEFEFLSLTLNSNCELLREGGLLRGGEGRERERERVEERKNRPL